MSIPAPVACPNCEHTKHIEHEIARELLLRAGDRVVIPNYRFSHCEYCGLQFVSPTQARHNHAQMQQATYVTMGMPNA